MMSDFSTAIDIAISYSETSAADARSIARSFESRLTVYDYKNWLDQQAGQVISRFSSKIYSGIPTVILVTRDWFERPATVLEMKFLSTNPEPKLVFDYAGEFMARKTEHRIQNFEFGAFVDGHVCFQSLQSFAVRLYGDAAAIPSRSPL